MTRERWAELMTAGPEMTKDDLELLRRIPKKTLIAKSVAIALAYYRNYSTKQRIAV